ncbi:MAG: peptidase, partial [Nitrosopumilus sp.]|nr:peptidase [Nitrosopumilus sp.]
MTFLVLLVSQVAFADVYVPLHEYLGYFDSNGIYTVVGNVKNENSFAIIPTITVSIIDGAERISKTIEHVPLGPDKEIPFKIKFPELTSNIPVLVNPEIKYEKTITNEIPIQVLYDNT